MLKKFHERLLPFEINNLQKKQKKVQSLNLHESLRSIVSTNFMGIRVNQHLNCRHFIQSLEKKLNSARFQMSERYLAILLI